MPSRNLSFSLEFIKFLHSIIVKYYDILALPFFLLFFISKNWHCLSFSSPPTTKHKTFSCCAHTRFARSHILFLFIHTYRMLLCIWHFHFEYWLNSIRFIWLCFVISSPLTPPTASDSLVMSSDSFRSECFMLVCYRSKIIKPIIIHNLDLIYFKCLFRLRSLSRMLNAPSSDMLAIELLL